MSNFDTRPRLQDRDFRQLSGDSITLSGETNIKGTFRYIDGGVNGYVFTSDSNGFASWQPKSVSADTNTFVTGGTLTGVNLTLGWNTGGSASSVDLSSLQFTGNTSGDCITDLYITNLYGCSPITVHDNLQNLTSTAEGNNVNVLGYSNLSTSDYSFIGGGSSHTITGSPHTVIGGGAGNEINTSSYSFIGGGAAHLISGGSYSTIGGGKNNIVDGGYSSIVGGQNNNVIHDNSHIIGSNLTSLSANTTYTENLTVQDDLVVNTNTFVVDSTTGYVGINTENPEYSYDFYNKRKDSRFVLFDGTPENQQIYFSGNGLTRFGSLVPFGGTNAGMAIGSVGVNAPTSNFGQTGDGFLYASAAAPGMNIINALSAGSAYGDYIRFYAGKDASSTADIHIQGSGATKGYVGVSTEEPTSNMDILATSGYEQLRLRTSYTPTSSGDTNGNIGDVSWDDNYFYTKTNSGWGRTIWDYGF